MSLATHAAIARASRAARSEAFEGSSVVSRQNARRVVSGDHRPALGHATRGATAVRRRDRAAASSFFNSLGRVNDDARGDAEHALERDAARGAQQTNERLHLVLAFSSFSSLSFLRFFAHHRPTNSRASAAYSENATSGSGRDSRYVHSAANATRLGTSGPMICAGSP